MTLCSTATMWNATKSASACYRLPTECFALEQPATTSSPFYVIRSCPGFCLGWLPNAADAPGCCDLSRNWGSATVTAPSLARLVLTGAHYVAETALRTGQYKAPMVKPTCWSFV